MHGLRTIDPTPSGDDATMTSLDIETDAGSDAARLVIVGGVAAGASAAAKARRTCEDCEIVLFEAGPYMSFANCGLPYYLGGEIPERDNLFVADPEQFVRRFRVDLRLQSRVTEIDPANRVVHFAAADGDQGQLHYDRLILATGTNPVTPPIPGVEDPSVFTCRTVPDVDAIMGRLRSLLPHEFEGSQIRAMRDAHLRALIIGGGYIGLECAEQLMHRGLQVTVVELSNQLMGPLDPEMVIPLQQALEASGTEVILRDSVTAIESREGQPVARLASGRVIGYDIAILGVGVRPAVDLASAAGLELGETGAIRVDAEQRTSDPTVFAAGDNCEATYLPTGRPVNIPLAGPANKQGRTAGCNAALDLAEALAEDPRRLHFGGVLGTGIVRVCGMSAGGTGLVKKVADQQGIPVGEAYVSGPSHAGYYPGAEPILLKILYDPETGRLLGGQGVGRDGVDKRLDVLATAIHGGLTVTDLEQLDLAYAPPFGAAKDVTILAGFIAANALRGTAPGMTPDALQEALDAGESLRVLDVRSAREYHGRHLRGALNIPLDELRERLNEVPQDGPLVVHCGVGYRSYAAQQILTHAGFPDVRNLYGGFALMETLLPPAWLQRSTPEMRATGSTPEPA